MSAAPKETVRFADVGWNVPNRITYLRLLLCVAAAWTMPSWPAPTAALIAVAFLLDIVDGKVARRLGQTSVVGDGIDWTADLFNSVLLMVWWGTLEPRLMPALVVLTMVEIAAAIFDFALTAADRYPPRPKQTGFCVVLEWVAPGDRWTRLGWALWFALPAFMWTRCLVLSGFDSAPWRAAQAALALPAAVFAWSNAALLWSSLQRWTERPREER